MKNRALFVPAVAAIALGLLCIPAQCAVIRVRTDGSNANDGSTWALAKKTITAALNSVSGEDDGDEIWVAAGTYLESITLKDGVGLYGGFAGTESDRDERRIAQNVTVIDANYLDNAVKALAGTTDTAIVDGFTIRHGSGAYGGGVYCLNSRAIISNNVITGNRNNSGDGGGIHCSGGAVGILNNLIYANNADRGGGIHLSACGKNTAVTNNTIADNTASSGGGGIYLYNCAGSVGISNNIVAFNTAGGAGGSGILVPILKSNDFYGNSGDAYSGIVHAGTTDIALDPRFVDRAHADYHLRTTSPASPCVNAGSNTASSAIKFDIDGQPRIRDAVVDIGADEVWPVASVAITSPTSDPTYLTIGSTLAISGTASDGVLGVEWANDRGGSGACTGTATWSAANVPLAPGTNVITVTADAGASSATATLTVYYDAGPPLISITQPTAESTYATGAVLLAIGGTASDDTGVVSVAWSSNRGGAGACVGTGTWSAAGINLKPGDNVITVAATDGAGRTGADLITVTFTDTYPPTAHINIPTTGNTYTTNESTIILGGIASDDLAIASVAWSNDSGGAGACTGTDNWTTPAITLQPGANVITVTSTDTSGNTGIDSITVSYDGEKPTISITSPSSTGTFATTVPRMDLAGTASDNVGVTSVRWAIASGVNGTCAGTTSWSVTGLPLHAGANAITVTASDLAGNTSDAVITVTFTDVTPPACTITSPTSDADYSTNAAQLSIAGTSSDDVSVATVTWSSDRGGSGTCTGTTSWSAAGITLKPGMNIITVTATDTSTHTGFDILNVTFTDITPPTVHITSPTSDPAFIRNCATAKLAGTASDNVGVTSVYWWNNRGGTGLCTGTDTWTVDGIDLEPGANVITIEAGDATSGQTGTASVTITRTDDSPGDAWAGLTMVGLPLVPDDTDPALTVGFSQNKWYSYQTPIKEYATYPNVVTWFEPVEYTPGRGFWAQFVGMAPTPHGSAVGQDKPAEIGLFAGWNLVGQPFLKPVDWDLDTIKVRQLGGESQSLRSSTGVLPGYAWGWDNTIGEYYLVYDSTEVLGVVGTLAPWRAYWIRADRDCTLILPVP